MDVAQFNQDITNHVIKGKAALDMLMNNRNAVKAGFTPFTNRSQVIPNLNDYVISVRGGFLMDDYDWVRIFAQQDRYIREDWGKPLLQMFTWTEREQEKTLVEEMFHRN